MKIIALALILSLNAGSTEPAPVLRTGVSQEVTVDDSLDVGNRFTRAAIGPSRVVWFPVPNCLAGKWISNDREERFADGRIVQKHFREDGEYGDVTDAYGQKWMNAVLGDVYEQSGVKGVTHKLRWIGTTDDAVTFDRVATFWRVDENGWIRGKNVRACRETFRAGAPGYMVCTNTNNDSEMVSTYVRVGDAEPNPKAQILFEAWARSVGRADLVP